MLHTIALSAHHSSTAPLLDVKTHAPNVEAEVIWFCLGWINLQFSPLFVVGLWRGIAVR
jgi:hypothetical protein